MKRLKGFLHCYIAVMLAPGPAALLAADEPAMDEASIRSRRFDAMKELPDGEGKQLTAIACSRCHELDGLSAYKGYWNRAQWLAMVESMVKNGAVLDAEGVRVVTDYLTRNYGRPIAETPAPR